MRVLIVSGSYQNYQNGRSKPEPQWGGGGSIAGIGPGICYLGDKPHSPNLSDLAECVILCTSWLPSPGKVYFQTVNIWVTLVELRGPILSARTPALHLLYQRSVRQKFSTPGISELSVQNIRYSGEMLSKDRCKTSAGFFVIPLLSQLWEEKNYCERNQLSSWRPNRHIHLYCTSLS